MIKINTISPTKTVIEECDTADLSLLRKELTYKDTSVAFNLKKLKENRWLQQNHPDTFKARKKELESQLSSCMLKYDQKLGKYWFHKGSISYLAGKFDLKETGTLTYPEGRKKPWRKPLPFDLYPYQDESVKRLIEAKHGCVELCTGCHVKGQEVLMFNGSIKKVEDVKVGDLLMGPDSKPRKVLKLHRGKDKMAKIIPVKGDSFVVNMGHILSLQRTNSKSQYRTEDKKRRKDFKGTNPIVNISVKDYLKQSKSFKHRYKLYRTGVDFEHSLTAIDPYILGLWLGDGSSDGPSLTTMDNEIEQEWLEYAKQLGLMVRKEVISENNLAKTFHMYNPLRGKGLNVLRNNLKHYNLVNNKHIPEDFKVNSEENRLKVLAGLIDSDGYLGNNYYEITQKNKKLSDDIVFIARSLGFGVYQKEEKKKSQNGTEGVYYRVTISGDINKIPVLLERKKAKPRKQIKNVLRTGFKVEELPEDEYFGFEVNEDNLYVMGDFTVTHNSGKTAIILTLARELGLKTVIVTPSTSIFLEIYKKLKFHFGTSKVGTLGGGVAKKIGRDITVCVSRSLTLLKPGTPEYDFIASADVVIGDESHTLAADTLEKVFHGVAKDIPYRFFLSGTQVRGDGKDKLLESIIGQKVYELTTKEAIDGGYICPVNFTVIETKTDDPNYYNDPLKAKRKHLLYNENIANIIAKVANGAWNSAQESTLVLVEELSQIKMLADKLTVPYEYVHSASKADAAKHGLEKRKVDEAVEVFNEGKAKVLIGTSCIATGTNLYPTHNVFNWVGGSSEVKTKQGAVGRSVRLLEKSEYKDLHKEKPVSKIYDFRLTNVPKRRANNSQPDILERHLLKRISMYKETNKDIRYIKIG